MQIVRNPPAHRKTAGVEQRYTNSTDAFKSRVEKRSELLSQTNGLARLQKYGRGQGE